MEYEEFSGFSTAYPFPHAEGRGAGLFQIEGGFSLARGQKVFRATMLVTLVVILSKITGFLRDMTLAAYFGTGIENDAYVSAYSLFYLPVLLFTPAFRPR